MTAKEISFSIISIIKNNKIVDEIVSSFYKSFSKLTEKEKKEEDEYKKKILKVLTEINSNLKILNKNSNYARPEPDNNS